jgi:hypothetical protein
MGGTAQGVRPSGRSQAARQALQTARCPERAAVPRPAVGIREGSAGSGFNRLADYRRPTRPGVRGGDLPDQPGRSRPGHGACLRSLAGQRQCAGSPRPRRSVAPTNSFPSADVLALLSTSPRRTDLTIPGRGVSRLMARPYEQASGRRCRPRLGPAPTANAGSYAPRWVAQPGRLRPGRLRPAGPAWWPRRGRGGYPCRGSPHRRVGRETEQRGEATPVSRRGADPPIPVNRGCREASACSREPADCRMHRNRTNISCSSRRFEATSPPLP